MHYAQTIRTAHPAHPRPAAVAAGPTPAKGTVCAKGNDARERAALDAAADVLGDRALAQAAAFRLPPRFKLSVVVPVFNEVRFIDEILRRVAASPVPKEIIVVDDFSTDGTRDRLVELTKKHQLRVLLHERNSGKGAAVRTGLAACTGDVVLVQDADLEYDPAEYPELIRPLVENRADVVFGSRYLDGRARNQRWTHRLANTLLTRFSNLCTGLRLSDMETCYKVFRRTALDDLTIEQDRFGLEPELTAKIARRKLRVCEVPVSYQARGTDEGKKIRLKDAFQALYCIVRYSWFAKA
jgi:glycosyltransferase involved in cell wall biosynthesis